MSSDAVGETVGREGRIEMETILLVGGACCLVPILMALGLVLVGPIRRFLGGLVRVVITVLAVALVIVAVVVLVVSGLAYKGVIVIPQIPQLMQGVVQSVPVPLAGQVYLSPQGPAYNAEWEGNRLWQKNLPEEGKRVGHVLSIMIPNGTARFYGVSCRLHLDPTHNGKGANNPKTVGYGNGLEFEVIGIEGVAWAFVVCDPTDVTGFSVTMVEYADPPTTSD
ncbi:MAG TPA: hypothetical protein VMW29_02255 [Candidatus Bathyarchaeia archaeon]|nr:hypothetical protein [Candidatus Bathyarchaeia archaeon]